jgi:hypothetical protein
VFYWCNNLIYNFVVSTAYIMVFMDGSINEDNLVDRLHQFFYMVRKLLTKG